MNYETMRSQLEKQIEQSKIDAKNEYEKEKDSFSLRTQIPEHQSTFQPCVSESTEYQQIAKEYEENRTFFKESQIKLETSCERCLQHLIDTKQ